MIISGEKFFYMEQPAQRAIFGIPQVHAVMMQEVILDYVEPETMDVLETKKLFFVMVYLASGEWAATRPNPHQDFVAAIANELADKAKQFHDATGLN